MISYIEERSETMSRNRKNYLRSALLLVCLASSFAFAKLVIAQERAATAVRPPVDYSPIIDKLKKQLPQQMAESNVPGLSIALVDGATLVWAEGFGTTERNGQTKVTADTLFSLQSISKTYAAAGFLIAVEKGLMKLDDPVKKYLPQFTVNSRFGADEAGKITFRHLLSHWSGLTHEAPCGNNFDDRDCPFADHIRSISETWLEFPVGERHSYSNLGIDLAGYCLEQRTRKPFDEFMNDELFRTLGMSSSTFNHKVAANYLSLAKGHTRDRILPVTPIPMIPAGSMYSTVKDMASVMIKNGYLYLEGWGGLKLTEYKPGLFFTADGEAVIFQNDRMFLGNRPYLKESGAPSLFSHQSTVIQSADKYADK